MLYYLQQIIHSPRRIELIRLLGIEDFVHGRQAREHPAQYKALENIEVPDKPTDPKPSEEYVRITFAKDEHGKGQRGLIVTQPKTGKTALLKDITLISRAVKSINIKKFFPFKFIAIFYLLKIFTITMFLIEKYYL